MLRKIISLALSFGLLFQQIGFAQVATELNLTGFLSKISPISVQDKFRPLSLRYFSYDSLNNNFKLLLDKGDIKQLDNLKAKEQTQILLNYFLVGVALPDEAFWVNLRPDSEDQIIGKGLERTDVGKILLEADLQLKKDTALATSPETPIGREYWNKLYQKAAQLYGAQNVTIPTLTRPWIVPGEIIIKESKNSDSAYVYKATLKVMLEQDHLKNSAVYNFADDRAKALNEYSSQLIREMIIPKLNKEINSSKKYANLRQVYYSLILSRWFKLRFTGKKGNYASLINTGNLANLTSQEAWSKTTYFKDYQKSFKDGEYNLKEPVYTPTGQVIRSYFSGGFDGTAAVLNITGGASGVWKSNSPVPSGDRTIAAAGNAAVNSLEVPDVDTKEGKGLRGAAEGFILRIEHWIVNAFLEKNEIRKNIPRLTEFSEEQERAIKKGCGEEYLAFAKAVLSLLDVRVVPNLPLLDHYAVRDGVLYVRSVELIPHIASEYIRLVRNSVDLKIQSVGKEAYLGENLIDWLSYFNNPANVSPERKKQILEDLYKWLEDENNASGVEEELVYDHAAAFPVPEKFKDFMPEDTDLKLIYAIRKLAPLFAKSGQTFDISTLDSISRARTVEGTKMIEILPVGKSIDECVDILKEGIQQKEKNGMREGWASGLVKSNSIGRVFGRIKSGDSELEIMRKLLVATGFIDTQRQDAALPVRGAGDRPIDDELKRYLRGSPDYTQAETISVDGDSFRGIRPETPKEGRKDDKAGEPHSSAGGTKDTEYDSSSELINLFAAVGIIPDSNYHTDRSPMTDARKVIGGVFERRDTNNPTLKDITAAISLAKKGNSEAYNYLTEVFKKIHNDPSKILEATFVASYFYARCRYYNKVSQFNDQLHEKVRKLIGEAYDKCSSDPKKASLSDVMAAIAIANDDSFKDDYRAKAARYVSSVFTVKEKGEPSAISVLAASFVAEDSSGEFLSGAVTRASNYVFSIFSSGIKDSDTIRPAAGVTDADRDRFEEKHSEYLIRLYSATPSQKTKEKVIMEVAILNLNSTVIDEFLAMASQDPTILRYTAIRAIEKRKEERTRRASTAAQENKSTPPGRHLLGGLTVGDPQVRPLVEEYQRLVLLGKLDTERAKALGREIFELTGEPAERYLSPAAGGESLKNTIVVLPQDVNKIPMDVFDFLGMKGISNYKVGSVRITRGVMGRKTTGYNDFEVVPGDAVTYEIKVPAVASSSSVSQESGQRDAAGVTDVDRDSFEEKNSEYLMQLYKATPSYKTKTEIIMKLAILNLNSIVIDEFLAIASQDPTILRHTAKIAIEKREEERTRRQSAAAQTAEKGRRSSAEGSITQLEHEVWNTYLTKNSVRQEKYRLRKLKDAQKVEIREAKELGEGYIPLVEKALSVFEVYLLDHPDLPEPPGIDHPGMRDGVLNVKSVLSIAHLAGEYIEQVRRRARKEDPSADSYIHNLKLTTQERLSFSDPTADKLIRLEALLNWYGHFGSLLFLDSRTKTIDSLVDWLNTGDTKEVAAFLKSVHNTAPELPAKVRDEITLIGAVENLASLLAETAKLRDFRFWTWGLNTISEDFRNQLRNCPGFDIIARAIEFDLTTVLEDGKRERSNFIMPSRGVPIDIAKDMSVGQISEILFFKMGLISVPVSTSETELARSVRSSGDSHPTVGGGISEESPLKASIQDMLQRVTGLVTPNKHVFENRIGYKEAVESLMSRMDTIWMFTLRNLGLNDQEIAQAPVSLSQFIKSQLSSSAKEEFESSLENLVRYVANIKQPNVGKEGGSTTGDSRPGGIGSFAALRIDS